MKLVERIKIDREREIDTVVRKREIVRERRQRENGEVRRRGFRK